METWPFHQLDPSIKTPRLPADSANRRSPDATSKVTRVVGLVGLVLGSQLYTLHDHPLGILSRSDASVGPTMYHVFRSEDHPFGGWEWKNPLTKPLDLKSSGREW